VTGRQPLADMLYEMLVTSRDKTVTDVAREFQMSRPAFSNVINGNASLSVELALKIEKKFGFQARSLLIQQLDEQISAARKR
jgi:plasmid maintenance system antidote protein VapI